MTLRLSRQDPDESWNLWTRFNIFHTLEILVNSTLPMPYRPRLHIVLLEPEISPQYGECRQNLRCSRCQTLARASPRIPTRRLPPATSRARLLAAPEPGSGRYMGGIARQFTRSNLVVFLDPRRAAPITMRPSRRAMRLSLAMNRPGYRNNGQGGKILKHCVFRCESKSAVSIFPTVWRLLVYEAQRQWNAPAQSGRSLR